VTENKEVEVKKPSKRRKLTGKKISVQQFMQMKHNDISDMLSDAMRESLGGIDDGFDIFIFGGSGDGKTTFSAMLLKELSPLGKTLHLAYEEGFNSSLKKVILRTGIDNLNEYEIMDNCSYDDLIYLLSKRKSARIVIIDSFQYARYTKTEWLSLKNKFVKGKKKKIFIVISHADGKRPRGSVATDALYDAQIKVFVRGKIAFIKSRFVGKQNFVIYEKGAKEYWQKQYKKMLTKQIF
jgi:hypothetical protein